MAKVEQSGDSRKSNFVLCSLLSVQYAKHYTGQACSASFLEEFFSETRILPVAYLHGIARTPVG
jgi:hypothetical protein